MKNKKITISSKIIISVLVVVLNLTSMASVFASEINYQNVSELINKERSTRGLTKLVLDPELDKAAKLKSKDMLNKNYFDHYAYGLSPWDFINLSGYDYMYAGENLAMDFNTSEGMVKAWMNSSTHRDNILNPDYKDMGIGIVKGEYTEKGVTRSTIIVTNMFGRKKPPIVKIFDYISKNFFNIF